MFHEILVPQIIMDIICNHVSITVISVEIQSILIYIVLKPGICSAIFPQYFYNTLNFLEACFK